MDNHTTMASSTAPASAQGRDWSQLTMTERDRLRRQAIEQAHELRAEAIAELWRGTDAWLGEAVDHARRAAERLAARLRQHAKRRAAAAPIEG